MQVRRALFAVAFAGLASFPVWGGFAVAVETPRAALELAPLVAAELEYEVLAPRQTARANPTGFERWAMNQHLAAQGIDTSGKRPPLVFNLLYIRTQPQVFLFCHPVIDICL